MTRKASGQPVLFFEDLWHIELRLNTIKSKFKHLSGFFCLSPPSLFVWWYCSTWLQQECQDRKCNHLYDLKKTKLNLKSKIKVKILSHNGEYLTKSAITKTKPYVRNYFKPVLTSGPITPSTVRSHQLDNNGKIPLGMFTIF